MKDEIRTLPLRIGGEAVDTKQYEFLAHADEYVRDYEGTIARVRRANSEGTPSTDDRGRFFARIAIAGQPEIEQAIDSAHRAYLAYSDSSFEERKALILEIGAALRREERDLRDLGVCEGRPRKMFELEIKHHYEERGTFQSQTLDYFVSQLKGQEVTPFDRITYFPVGVVGFSPPGNAPIYNSLVGMMGALLAGNAIIMRPPRNRAAQTMRFTEICQEVAARHGFPGLINSVVGDTREILDAWGKSPRIGAVVFYGGTGLGTEIGSRLMKRFKKAVLELSGSDAAVVWDDADITPAATAVYMTRFLIFSGMVCVAPKRLFVHRKIYDRFLDRLLALLSVEWTVGPPSEIFTEAPCLMPIFDIDRDVCVATLEDARRKGKPILRGGRWFDHTGAESPDGVFLDPTLIGDATPDLHCMKHEIFGPLLPVAIVDDIEQAIDYTNDSLYGLRASIWTRDPDIAERYASRVQTGSVFVNDHPFYFDARAPYLGGVKASGFTGAKYFHLELSVCRYIHTGRSFPHYHYNEGVDHLRAERFQQALWEFEKALQLDDSFAMGYFGRARARLELGQPAEAIADYRRALALRPDVAEFREGLELALRRTET